MEKKPYWAEIKADFDELEGAESSDDIKESKPNAHANHYAVYMSDAKHTAAYVCDYIAEDTPEAQKLNELGLTLRARLRRSNGVYAMLEGSIFNPDRLTSCIIDLCGFDVHYFKGGEYRDGYWFLSVEADGCVNKYQVYSQRKVDELTKFLNEFKKK